VRRALLAVALASFVALGLGDGALGVAWPSVASAFDRGLSELGLLITVVMIGYLGTSLFAGRLERRFGIGPLLVASALLMAAGYLAFAGAPSWGFVLGGQLVTGAGAALVDTGLNAYVALHHSTRAMHFLHAAFGVGATIGPIVMASAIGLGAGWRAGYLVLAVAQGILILSFLRFRSSWQVRRANPEPTRHESGVRVLALALLVFLLYTGVEVAAGQWSFTVLTVDRGLTTAAAGGIVAGYWGLLTAGRIAAGWAGDRVTPRQSLLGGSVIAAVGLVWFWIGAGPWAGGIGLLAAGFGLAPIFPALVLLTPGRVGAEQTAGAVGYQLAAAGVGAFAVPGAIGLLVRGSGLAAVAPSLVVLAIVMAAAAAAASRSTAQRNGSMHSG
jgi:fucose permease